AAQLASAGTYPARDFGLIARANLFHLDANPQRVGEIADQVAEIHAALGDEIEDDLARIEGVVGADQLHLDAALANALDAQAARVCLARQRFPLGVEVAVGSKTDNGTQPGKVDRARGFVRLDLDGAQPGAGLAFDHHAFAAAQRPVAGQEIIQMAGLLETDRDDFRQRLRAFKRIDVCHYLLLTPHRMAGDSPPILSL